MAEIELKILPQYFKEVVEGTKTFEYRKDDRGFEVGDTLILKEWDYELIYKNEYGEERWGNPHYTGRIIKKEISYILRGGIPGCRVRKGLAILGLKPSGIELKNIDLTGITLADELDKRDEEYKEFADALLTYLWDTNGITREHLKEEACDVIQVVLSILKLLDIELEEITEYWNTKHLEKIKSRPRKEDKYE